MRDAGEGGFALVVDRPSSRMGTGLRGDHRDDSAVTATPPGSETGLRLLVAFAPRERDAGASPAPKGEGIPLQATYGLPPLAACEMFGLGDPDRGGVPQPERALRRRLRRVPVPRILVGDGSSRVSMLSELGLMMPAPPAERTIPARSLRESVRAPRARRSSWTVGRTGNVIILPIRARALRV